MAISDINGVTSKVQSGNYNSAWLSLTSNASLLAPQYHNKLFKQYGARAVALEILGLMGNTIDVPDATITTVEKSWPQHPIKVKTAINTGAAGAAISIVLHADNFDTNVNHQVHVNDVVMIPAKYQAAGVLSSRGYVVTALSTTTLANDTLTCNPLSNGTTLVKSQIGVQIPANTYLFVAYNVFARGTGQPAGYTDSFTTRTHASFISKASCGFEGDIIARSYEDITGLEGTGKFTNAKLIETEFKLNEFVENAILFGELNDNTSTLTEASDFGGTNAMASGMGLYQWADLLAQKHQYTGNPAFDDFYTSAVLLSSQDIVNTTVMWLTGEKYNRDLESAGLDFVKEFSSGTDLYKSIEGRLGFVLKGLTLGSLDHAFYTIPAFSKAGGAGVMTAGEYSYEFPEMALGIPMENVSYESFGGGANATPRSLPNVTLAYVNHNGENNRKVMKINKGVTGVYSDMDAFNDSHGFTYWMLTQYMLIIGEANKFILMRKAK